MLIVAELADECSFGEIRTTHEQNLMLADVKNADLHKVWSTLDEHGLAQPNIGTLTDMICCPGLDFCSLANASSISIADAIKASRMRSTSALMSSMTCTTLVNSS